MTTGNRLPCRLVARVLAFAFAASISVTVLATEPSKDAGTTATDGSAAKTPADVDARLGAVGDSCTRTADCATGLHCVRRKCIDPRKQREKDIEAETEAEMDRDTDADDHARRAEEGESCPVSARCAEHLRCVLGVCRKVPTYAKVRGNMDSADSGSTPDGPAAKKRVRWQDCTESFRGCPGRRSYLFLTFTPGWAVAVGDLKGGGVGANLEAGGYFKDSTWGYAIDGFIAKSDPETVGGFLAVREGRDIYLEVMLGYATFGDAAATGGASIGGQIHLTAAVSLSPLLLAAYSPYVDGGRGAGIVLLGFGATVTSADSR